MLMHNAHLKEVTHHWLAN